MSDWPDQFFSSICNGVPSSCLAYGTLPCGFSSSSTCVLLTPTLIICRLRDNCPAYISDLFLVFASMYTRRCPHLITDPLAYPLIFVRLGFLPDPPGVSYLLMYLKPGERGFIGHSFLDPQALPWPSSCRPHCVCITFEIHTLGALYTF